MTVDVSALDPDALRVLEMNAAAPRPPADQVPIAEARAGFKASRTRMSPDPQDVADVRDREIPGPGGMIRVRCYRGRGTNAKAALPVYLYFHGGGWAVGDLDTHDVTCRQLANDAQCAVIAVDYRLAPEHPFPAAVDDALEAFRWAQANASALGADPARVGVAGDSAGGNLASNVARLAKPGPALQLLFYPTVDRTRPHRSLELFADGFFLTAEEIAWYQHQYAAGVDLREPRISPLLATDLGGLAPALVVTAGFDPLRDEGEAYAHALRDARTHAVLRRFDDLIHGFINMTAVSRACADALVEVSGAARAMLDAVR